MWLVATISDFSVLDILVSTGLTELTRNLDKHGCVLSPSTLEPCGIWAIVCLLLSFSVPVILTLWTTASPIVSEHLNLQG